MVNDNGVADKSCGSLGIVGGGKVLEDGEISDVGDPNQAQK